MIRTELCDLMGLKYPVIQAGMGPYSTNRLAAAAANAGALEIIKSGDIDTAVARGLVGPARYLINEASRELTGITVNKAPGLYLGQPDDMMTLDPEVLRIEIEGIAAIFAADEKKALMAGGGGGGGKNRRPSHSGRACGETSE